MNDLTNNMTLVSESRHKVFTDGQNFMKQARNNENAHEIVLEYSVQKALGQNVKLLPGPPVSLLTPNLGNQIVELNKGIVRKQTNKIFELKSLDKNILKEIAELAPNINSIRSSIKRRIHERIAEDKVPESLLKFVPKELDLSKFNLTLVHADPRPENWVVSDSGEILMIDWESACFAPWEFGLASLASHTIEYDHPELVSEIFNEIEKDNRVDYSLYEWSMKLRAVSVASWYYYDEGKASGDWWLKQILNNMYGK